MNFEKSRNVKIRNDNPLVSVLMPVYNGELYLKESIESILNQSYENFEFIIIDDGSRDSSLNIISSYNDPRIKVIENDVNLGLIKTLNKGLRIVKGKYIARMDCDDISLSDRFSTQVEFMEHNEQIGVCGTQIKLIGPNNKIIWKYSDDPNITKSQLLFSSSVGHPTVMIRRSYLEKFKLKYDEHYPLAEDYELWTRCSKYFPIVSLKDVLYFYRQHPNQVTQKLKEEKINSTRKIRLNLLEELFENIKPDDLDLHNKLSFQQFKFNNEFVIKKTEKWLMSIIEENDKRGIYSKEALHSVISDIWFKVCFHNSDIGPRIWDFFWESSLNKSGGLGNVTKHQFLAKFFKYGNPDNKKIIKKSIISWLEELKVSIKTRDLYIWGTGTKSSHILKILKEYHQGTNIKGFIDNDTSKTKNNSEIISSSTLIDKYANGVKPYILIGSTYVDDLTTQLTMMGYKNKKDFNIDFPLLYLTNEEFNNVYMNLLGN